MPLLDHPDTTIRWEDPGRCTGCRACELACSFHLAGVFRPDQSSIFVERDDLEGRVYLELDVSCDHCPSEDIPLCVRYCAPRAITTRIMRERWSALPDALAEDAKASAGKT